MENFWSSKKIQNVLEKFLGARKKARLSSLAWLSWRPMHIPKIILATLEKLGKELAFLRKYYLGLSTIEVDAKT